MQSAINKTGKYERPTPDFIAFAVKEIRSYLGWKQFALADEAQVNIKTIERIEGGRKVSDDNLRKVALALKLREGAFVDPSYEPSPPELAALTAEVQKIKAETTTVELADFADSRDFEKILSAQAYNIDTSSVAENLAREAAGLADNVRDYGDLHRDLSCSERLVAYQELLVTVRHIENHGYTARWAVYRTEDRFDVAVVAFNRNNYPTPRPHMWFRIAIVPRRLFPIGESEF